MSKKAEEKFIIPAPDLRIVELHIRGVAPYLQHAFPEKARKEMHEKHEAGSLARSKRGNREARDFQAEYEGAKHVSTEGWCGIPAAAFRAGMISACRLINFKMTLAKLSIFVMADGFDHVDSQPLVRLYGEPTYHESWVRNAKGVIDLRARPLWKQWGAVLRVQYDAGQFSAQDVSHLLMRVGLQVGVGDGRPDSKMSAGMGFGIFELTNTDVRALFKPEAQAAE